MPERDNLVSDLAYYRGLVNALKFKVILGIILNISFLVVIICLLSRAEEVIYIYGEQDSGKLEMKWPEGRFKLSF